MAKSTAKPNDKTSIADAEYKRLIDLYTQAGADEIKIKVNDELIRKVAELFADLETIKTLPLLIFDKPDDTKGNGGGQNARQVHGAVCRRYAKTQQRYARSLEQ